MHKLEEFMKMREDSVAYELFCEEILPCIVGKTIWDKERAVKEILKIASATDEAWGLLLLENSWDLWKKMAESEDAGEKLDKKNRPSTKWTSTAMSAGKYEGWGDDGIPRYNTLVKAAKEDRAKNSKFDETFLRKRKLEKEAGGKGSRKRVRDGAEETVVIESDMEFLTNRATV